MKKEIKEQVANAWLSIMCLGFATIVLVSGAKHPVIAGYIIIGLFVLMMTKWAIGLKSGSNNEKKVSIEPVRQKIRWFEIPASNFDRATNFYSKVFDIKLNVVELNGVKHGVFDLDLESGQTTGAVVDNGNTEVKSSVVLFFDGNPSISELERRILENGGTILVSKTLIRNKVEKNNYIIPKNFIDGGNIGYFAYFLDTEGNKMGLFAGS